MAANSNTSTIRQRNAGENAIAGSQHALTRPMITTPRTSLKCLMVFCLAIFSMGRYEVKSFVVPTVYQTPNYPLSATVLQVSSLRSWFSSVTEKTKTKAKNTRQSNKKFWNRKHEESTHKEKLHDHNRSHHDEEHEELLVTLGGAPTDNETTWAALLHDDAETGLVSNKSRTEMTIRDSDETKR